MVKKCIYCGNGISDESVVDVCYKCGIGVWGEKMFKAIIEGMTNAKEKGDLFQGSINIPATNTKTKNPSQEPAKGFDFP